VCSGCARLSVPLTLASEQARFAISLVAARDLSSATITFRVARLKGTDGTLLAYVQEGAPNFARRSSAPIAIASISTSMQDIVWDVAGTPATAGSADTTAIQRIGLEISGADGRSFSNPTVIYLDRVSTAVVSWTFDTVDSVYTATTMSGPAGQIWLNSYSAETNVAGASITWVGP
jgi:hypothetical protein